MNNEMFDEQSGILKDNYDDKGMESKSSSVIEAIKRRRKKQMGDTTPDMQGMVEDNLREQLQWKL